MYCNIILCIILYSYTFRHCDGSIKFWHASSGMYEFSTIVMLTAMQIIPTVSFQPFITISTQMSFQRTVSSQHNSTGESGKFTHSPPTSPNKKTPTKTTPTAALFEPQPYLPDDLAYFPVSHVILNTVDWSLIVANDGLCVMIYSFQPSKPVTPIKVCIIIQPC